MNACDMIYDWDEVHAASCTMWTDCMLRLKSCIMEENCMAGLANCTKGDQVHA